MTIKNEYAKIMKEHAKLKFMYDFAIDFLCFLEDELSFDKDEMIRKYRETLTKKMTEESKKEKANVN